MSQRPLGAQISHMLKSRGVEVIFGIPGVHNQEMYRGIEEAGLTHILARHEQGAGFMADGYARATGKPGVAYVITGPGLCNIMTPMGQAYSDSVPILVIASCLDDVVATRGQLHQMLDQEGAAATVCDWSETARTADAAYHLIDRALLEFATMRKRPKAIHAPIALLEGMAGPPSANRDIPASRTDDQEVAKQIALHLSGAQKPLFVFGGGVKSTFARAVASRFGAATFTTYAGRGVLGADYPLDFGTSLARGGSADVIASADVVVAMGTELAEVDLWRDNLGHIAKLIRVDIDPDVLTDRHKPEVVFHADASAVLTSLADDKTQAQQQTDWTAQDVANTRTRWRAEVMAERPGIIPVVDALRHALPADTMIYSDMTQFAYAALEVWPANHPGLWHHPSCFGTLGYAMPAAIGGKIGRGDLPVVAIAGDYGFQYSLQELMVAVELELTLPIIIWDNGKLGEIEDSMVAAQIAPNAVIQKNPDFVALAKAYGAAACAPQTLADLTLGIQKALAAKGPTLIYVTPAIADT